MRSLTDMYSSKKILHLLLLLFTSVALVGCDSNDDEEGAGDAEQFLGSWRIVSAADQDGQRDQTAIFAALGTLTINLNEDESYTLVLEYTDPDTPDLTIGGTYTVNEVSSRLILSVQLEGLPQVDLTLMYNFNSDTEVELTADATTLALLLGAELDGNVILVAQKQ